MACFADINVSEGSVATYARCGGIFDIYLNALKKFLKSVKNWQNYGHEPVAPFFWPTFYVCGTAAAIKSNNMILRSRLATTVADPTDETW